MRDLYVLRPRAERTSVEGVVLVEDAAGYENPLQGLGLSFALRDVRELSDLLLATPDWSVEVLERFGAGRSGLRRLSKLATELDLPINEGHHVQDPAERARRLERAVRDDVVRTLVQAAFVGFDLCLPILRPRRCGAPGRGLMLPYDTRPIRGRPTWRFRGGEGHGREDFGPSGSLPARCLTGLPPAQRVCSRSGSR